MKEPEGFFMCERQPLDMLRLSHLDVVLSRKALFAPTSMMTLIVWMRFRGLYSNALITGYILRIHSILDFICQALEMVCTKFSLNIYCP